MKKYILIIAVVVLAACEKETYYDYAIENNTSSAIKVDGKDIIHSTELDKDVTIGNKISITNWSKRGKTTDLLSPTMMFGDDLIITNANGDTLKKDYRSLSNWETDVDDNRATANHKYVFKISDNDF